MASVIITNSINAFKDHSKIHFGSSKSVPKAAHVPIKSRNNNPLPEFKIDEYMTVKAKKINKALDEAVPIVLQHPTALLDGGKRLYGTLCIASCELVGGNESLVMPLACATEMFMTMVLSRTLLCHAIAYMATKTNGASPDRLVKAISEISSAVSTRGVLSGWIKDINSKGKDMISLRELEIIHRLKCGEFIEASIVSGVLIGGGCEEEIVRLRKYGKCLGLAYQVSGDILDVGKEAGDKASYPKLMGMDGANKYARELVAEAIEELACFDSTRAAPLYHMANFAVSQRNSLVECE